jgi:ring-1,2-phenylacetyl-CoA epoxidase subunit PaaC
VNTAAAAPLAPALVTPVSELLLAMADDEAVLGWTDSEWTGIAPLLEEDVAMSSLSQDELGHAQVLYGLLADLTGTDVDALAYDREPAAYRHARLLDHGRGDWAMTIARRFLYEHADAVRLDALTAGSWRPLADAATAIAREERYHRMHIDAWLVRLARASGEPRDRLVRALTTLGPDAGTVFRPQPSDAALVEAGMLAAPMAELASRWRAVIEPMLTSLGLPVPPDVVDPANGRTAHGSAFAELHATFTSVRGSDPGATW